MTLKKSLSLLLAFCMTLCMIPTGAFAQTHTHTLTHVPARTPTFADGVYTDGVIPLKRMWDTLDRRVRDELGYDGVIVSVCSSGDNTWEKYGFDAWNAYNWGAGGYSLDTNRNNNLTVRANKDVYAIPTISVGFNHVVWAPDDCYPMMTAADYKLAHEWVRDTYLPAYAQNDGLPWNDNLVWLSTWNEYGEGTYIMPCEDLNGFGYLDALREVYTRGGAHADTVPTAEQKARINHNYPQDKRLLRAYGNGGESPARSFDLTSSGVNYADCFAINACSYIGADANGASFKSDASDPNVLFVLKSALWSGLSCDDHPYIEIKCRGRCDHRSTVNLGFYFTTAAQRSESLSKYVGAQIPCTLDTTGEWAEHGGQFAVDGHAQTSALRSLRRHRRH